MRFLYEVEVVPITPLVPCDLIKFIGEVEIVVPSNAVETAVDIC